MIVVCALDDDTEFLDELKGFGMQCDNLRVVAFSEVDEFTSYLNHADPLDAPDVAFVDYYLPGDERGSDLIEGLRRQSASTTFVVLTGSDEQGVAYEVGAMGAQFWNKDALESPADFEKAVFRALYADRGRRHGAIESRERLSLGLAHLIGELIHDTKAVFGPMKDSLGEIRRRSESLSAVVEAESDGERSVAMDLSAIRQALEEIERKVEIGLGQSVALWEVAETGRIDLRPTDFDAEELLRELCREWLESDRTWRVECAIGRVHLDHGAFEKITRQLLGNIRDHVEPQAPVDIRLWAEAMPDARVVLLSVRDYGDGVREEIRDTLFEPGVTGSPREPDGHWGLGLWIARRLAEAHGSDAHRGRITVRSPLADGGAQFLVELPEGTPGDRAGPRPSAT